MPGQRVAYASCSLSLAALEYFVNLGPQDAPADLVAIQVAIPAGVPVEKVDISSLPAAWRAYPYPAKLHEITARWINSGSSAGLLVPSAVIPSENNLLILPEHPDFRLLTFGEPERFSFDPRMWK